MKKRYLFILVLILIICGCNNKESVKIDDYKIKYKTNNSEYVLNIKDNTIYVEKYDIVICVKAPCNPIKTKEFKQEVTNEYKTFIENLFKDKSNNEITITNNDLNKEDVKILSKIIKEEITITDISYKITKENYNNPNYINKGYYINNNVISISMGEKNTGGYSITIDSIVNNNNQTIIYVKENIPNSDSIVTQVFTYPTTDVEFNKIPDKLKIINKDTYEEYLQKN